MATEDQFKPQILCLSINFSFSIQELDKISLKYMLPFPTLAAHANV